jgi:Tfp pilus assembly protein PilF
MDLWPEQTTYATYAAAVHRDVMINPQTPDDARRDAFDSAVSVLTTALERVPDDVLALRLATIHRDWGDLAADEAARDRAWAQAGDQYRLALARNPRNPENLTEYGAFLERLGQTEAARQAFRTASDLHPGDTETWAGLMRAALAAGDVADAAEALDGALARHMDDPEPVGRTIRAAEHWPIDTLRARQSRVMFLARTGHSDEARLLLDALSGERRGDPATLGLRDWLERGGES